jgi:hypothetical protein
MLIEQLGDGPFYKHVNDVVAVMRNLELREGEKEVP